MRQRGQTRHPKNQALMAEAAFLRSKVEDPQGMLRHYGYGPTLDAFEDMPTLPAIPMWGYKAEYVFQNALNVDTTNVWAEVKDASGTGLTVQDERGGLAKFTNAAGDNDHYYYVSVNEIAKLDSSKDLWFFTKIRILVVAQADWYLGLCKKVTGADSLFDSRGDGIGFYGDDGSAYVRLEATKNGVPTQDTDGVLSLTDDTIYNLAFHVLTTSEVHFFGGLPGARYSYLGTIAASLPDDEELALSFGCRNGTTSANAMSIGRTIVIQDE